MLTKCDGWGLDADVSVPPPDVISIEKTGEHFRLIYDVKGRFAIHRITVEEAKVNAHLKSCCVSSF